MANETQTSNPEYNQKYDLRECTPEEVSDDIVNIAYEHSINRLQEISDAIKIINTRAILLLGYLIGALALFFSKNSNSSALFIPPDNPIISIVLIEYIIIIIIIGIRIVRPSESYIIYSEPKDLIVKDSFEYNEKTLKFNIVQALQIKIAWNKHRHDCKYRILNRCILAAFVPPVIFAGYLIFLVAKWTYVLCDKLIIY